MEGQGPNLQSKTVESFGMTQKEPATEDGLEDRRVEPSNFSPLLAKPGFSAVKGLNFNIGLRQGFFTSPLTWQAQA